MTEYLPDKPFFRVDEVAKYFSVSKSSVYRWIDEGRLQSVKVAGSTVRIRRADILEAEKENLS
ncbi:helix-turn-helix transcriptional regulator [Syntrophorhabdus aromaticivorans]|uniref:helix-turn-helix transcriptional regulator n=1 Tax=Syntrophorhabdus aromaticivorans TaxID=328301 RepID=UPI0003FCEF9D|nr:helix-turn-helix domain-containing protein [Syntrophorhabdus aromaticivorans]OPY05430.1 MAG: Helix-turn-helix domain protein [Syntrophorhabdus sp. PtaB.Bin184]